MNKDKEKLYLENRERARWYYHNTDTSMSQIARHLEISVTTVDHMVTGKGEPKFVKALIDKGELEP